jgi:hypothetical protein
MVMHICTVRYRPVALHVFSFLSKTKKGTAQVKTELHATCLMRSALFWDVTQRREAGRLPTLLTTYRSRLQGPRSPRRIIYP